MCHWNNPQTGDEVKSREEILRRFPNASLAFIRANLSDCDSRPDAFVECGSGNGSLAAGKVKKADGAKFLVRVVSVRRRLLDEDNLCEKYHVDLCRYAGVVPCDSPERCQIQTTQRKAAKGETERTEIEVWKLV